MRSFPAFAGAHAQFVREQMPLQRFAPSTTATPLTGNFNVFRLEESNAGCSSAPSDPTYRAQGYPFSAPGPAEREALTRSPPISVAPATRSKAAHRSCLRRCRGGRAAPARPMPTSAPCTKACGLPPPSATAWRRSRPEVTRTARTGPARTRNMESGGNRVIVDFEGPGGNAPSARGGRRRDPGRRWTAARRRLRPGRPPHRRRDPSLAPPARPLGLRPRPRGRRLPLHRLPLGIGPAPPHPPSPDRPRPHLRRGRTDAHPRIET